VQKHTSIVGSQCAVLRKVVQTQKTDNRITFVSLAQNSVQC